MPYTRRQIERILHADLIPDGRMPYAGRVCESYLKRRLFLLEDRAVREQFKAYRAAYRDLREMAHASASRAGGVNRQFRDDYYPRAVARLRTLERTIGQIAAHHTAEAIYAGYYGRAWMLDMQTSASYTPHMPGPETAALRNGPLREAWDEKQVWQLLADELGPEWYDVFNLEFDTLIIKLRRSLNTGMRAGEGIADIVERVGRDMGINVNPDAGYRANFYRVQTITRTYVMSASNIGAQQLYADNADVLSGSEHLTARDERVCPVCAGMDGKIYPLGEWNIPPLNTHPNCRCTVIPVVKDDYLSDLIDQRPRQTLQEWADEQGVAALLAAFLTGRLMNTDRV